MKTLTATTILLLTLAGSICNASPIWEELIVTDPAVVAECSQEHPETCLEEGQDDIRDTYETED